MFSRQKSQRAANSLWSASRQCESDRVRHPELRDAAGGKPIDGNLGYVMDRPLDRAAKDLLHRAPVITLDAGEPVLLLLRAGLSADDFDT